MGNCTAHKHTFFPHSPGSGKTGMHRKLGWEPHLQSTNRVALRLLRGDRGLHLHGRVPEGKRAQAKAEENGSFWSCHEHKCQLLLGSPLPSPYFPPGRQLSEHLAWLLLLYLLPPSQSSEAVSWSRSISSLEHLSIISQGQWERDNSWFLEAPHGSQTQDHQVANPEENGTCKTLQHDQTTSTWLFKIHKLPPVSKAYQLVQILQALVPNYCILCLFSGFIILTSLGPRTVGAGARTLFSHPQRSQGTQDTWLGQQMEQEQQLPQ